MPTPTPPKPRTPRTGQKERNDMVKFNASANDRKIIRDIALRAEAMAKKHKRKDFDLVSAEMDITACHCNGNKLRLADLLAADDFNFAHDVFGIGMHLNRENGKLEHHFSPRYSAPKKARAKTQ